VQAPLFRVTALSGFRLSPPLLAQPAFGGPLHGGIGLIEFCLQKGNVQKQKGQKKSPDGRKKIRRIKPAGRQLIERL